MTETARVYGGSLYELAQEEHLEEVPVPVRGDAPLLVVIRNVERVRSRPGATGAFGHAGDDLTRTGVG